jgi:hypothetical protein
MLRQREEWIRFSYSNENTKDREEEKAGVVDRRLNVVPNAKRTPFRTQNSQQKGREEACLKFLLFST